jgi:hypothetical protein
MGSIWARSDERRRELPVMYALIGTDIESQRTWNATSICGNSLPFGLQSALLHPVFQCCRAISFPEIASMSGCPEGAFLSPPHGGNSSGSGMQKNASDLVCNPFLRPIRVLSPQSCGFHFAGRPIELLGQAQSFFAWHRPENGDQFGAELLIG